MTIHMIKNNLIELLYCCTIASRRMSSTKYAALIVEVFMLVKREGRLVHE